MGLLKKMVSSLFEGSRSDRKNGTVKWFSMKKGYGFITCTDQKDWFVHFKDIRGEGYRVLKTGQQVSFTVTETTKGEQAIDIVPE